MKRAEEVDVPLVLGREPPMQHLHVEDVVGPVGITDSELAELEFTALMSGCDVRLERRFSRVVAQVEEELRKEVDLLEDLSFDGTLTCTDINTPAHHDLLAAREHFAEEEPGGRQQEKAAPDVDVNESCRWRGAVGWTTGNDEKSTSMVIACSADADQNSEPATSNLSDSASRTGEDGEDANGKRKGEQEDSEDVADADAAGVLSKLDATLEQHYQRKIRNLEERHILEREEFRTSLKRAELQAKHWKQKVVQLHLQMKSFTNGANFAGTTASSSLSIQHLTAENADHLAEHEHHDAAAANQLYAAEVGNLRQLARKQSVAIAKWKRRYHLLKGLITAPIGSSGTATRSSGTRSATVSRCGTPSNQLTATASVVVVGDHEDDHVHDEPAAVAVAGSSEHQEAQGSHEERVEKRFPPDDCIFDKGRHHSTAARIASAAPGVRDGASATSSSEVNPGTRRSSFLEQLEEAATAHLLSDILSSSNTRAASAGLSSALKANEDGSAPMQMQQSGLFCSDGDRGTETGPARDVDASLAEQPGVSTEESSSCGVETISLDVAGRAHPSATQLAALQQQLERSFTGETTTSLMDLSVSSFNTSTANLAQLMASCSISAPKFEPKHLRELFRRRREEFPDSEAVAAHASLPKVESLLHSFANIPSPATTTIVSSPEEEQLLEQLQQQRGKEQQENGNLQSQPAHSNLRACIPPTPGETIAASASLLVSSNQTLPLTRRSPAEVEAALGLVAEAGSNTERGQGGIPGSTIVETTKRTALSRDKLNTSTERERDEPGEHAYSPDDLLSTLCSDKITVAASSCRTMVPPGDARVRDLRDLLIDDADLVDREQAAESHHDDDNRSLEDDGSMIKNHVVQDAPGDDLDRATSTETASTSPINYTGPPPPPALRRRNPGLSISTSPHFEMNVEVHAGTTTSSKSNVVGAGSTAAGARKNLISSTGCTPSSPMANPGLWSTTSAASSNLRRVVINENHNCYREVSASPIASSGTTDGATSTPSSSSASGAPTSQPVPLAVTSAASPFLFSVPIHSSPTSFSSTSGIQLGGTGGAARASPSSAAGKLPVGRSSLNSSYEASPTYTSLLGGGGGGAGGFGSASSSCQFVPVTSSAPDRVTMLSPKSDYQRSKVAERILQQEKDTLFPSAASAGASSSSTAVLAHHSSGRNSITTATNRRDSTNSRSSVTQYNALYGTTSSSSQNYNQAGASSCSSPTTPGSTASSSKHEHQPTFTKSASSTLEHLATFGGGGGGASTALSGGGGVANGSVVVPRSLSLPDPRGEAGERREGGCADQNADIVNKSSASSSSKATNCVMSTPLQRASMIEYSRSPSLSAIGAAASGLELCNAPPLAELPQRILEGFGSSTSSSSASVFAGPNWSSVSEGRLHQSQSTQQGVFASPEPIHLERLPIQRASPSLPESKTKIKQFVQIVQAISPVPAPRRLVQQSLFSTTPASGEQNKENQPIATASGASTGSLSGKLRLSSGSVGVSPRPLPLGSPPPAPTPPVPSTGGRELAHTQTTLLAEKSAAATNIAANASSSSSSTVRLRHSQRSAQNETDNLRAALIQSRNAINSSNF
ncbi:unnamed protein product [Amoebophrya sp. A120]|nr:unnamed protein product [Amoebophrya sp. A120]|eukprot:GSA120T00004379001.1